MVKSAKEKLEEALGVTIGPLHPLPRKEFESVNPDHPISKFANQLSGMALELAGHMQVSKMDICSALASACGQILADASLPASGGKPLPREEALKRMDALRTVMGAAYELRFVAGEG